MMSPDEIKVQVGDEVSREVHNAVFEVSKAVQAVMRNSDSWSFVGE